MKQWVHKRDNYTRIQILTRYFTNIKYIFVVESETLTIEAANKQEFVVTVGYEIGSFVFLTCVLMEICICLI